MTKKFICGMCAEECETERPDEEALAEMIRDFGSVPDSQQVVICDNCYQKVRPDTHSEEYAAYQKEAAPLPKE